MNNNKQGMLTFWKGFWTGRLSFFLLSMIFMLSSCYKKSQAAETKGQGFEVEFLFEKDGIKVYRFWDGGYPRYFTSKGETMSQISHGKSTTTENIQ